MLTFKNALFGLLLAGVSSLCAAADHQLKPVAGVPDGLAPAVSGRLAADGWQVTGAKGAVVDVWFCRDLAVKSNFKPGSSQMYPLQPGQLIGAMRVAKGSGFTDFRGQSLKDGVYTLRFGLQPMDGNHVGTSETFDFLLALPAQADSKADNLTYDDLKQGSSKAAGSSHPAIFSLLDPKRAEGEARLEKEGRDHWVLSLSLPAKDGDKAAAVKLRLVVIGQFEG